MATKKSNTIDKEASNFWVRRGDGDPIAVDVYKGVKGVEALNLGGEAGKFLNTFNLDVSKALSSSSGLLSSITSKLGDFNQIQSVFKSNGNILDKLGSVSGLTRGVLSNLNIPKDSTLFKDILNSKDMIVSIAEKGRLIKDVDWGNISSIANVVSEFTGTKDLFKITDLGAQGAFASELLNECIKNGFPNSFEKIAGAIGNTTLVKSIVSDVLPSIISTSDLSNLKGIVNFFSKGELNSLFPGLVDNVSRFYKRNWFDFDTDDVTRFGQFNDTMDSLDDNWWRTYRATTQISSVERIINGSDAFKNMYHTGLQVNNKSAKDRATLAVIKVVRPTTVMRELRKHFPDTVIKDNTILNKTEDLDLLF